MGCFPQLIKFLPGVYQYLFGALALGNIMLIGDPVCDVAFIVGKRVDVPLVNKLRAVFAVVHGLPKK